jgi:hypothetical protein
VGLDYSLKLATDMNRVQALGLLEERIQGLQSSEEDAFLCGSDIIVAVVEMGRGSQSLMEEGFGFRPNLSVLFRFPSNHNYSNFVQTMLRGALLLLEHGRDGVLLFNGEIIVLQRIGGQLVFNADYRLHADERWVESMVPVPFVRRSLPSPFL